jgi:hypothetical protein
MLRKLVFSALLLLLALALDASSAAAAKKPCTISCASDPTVTCSSATGSCSFVFGAYDYIVCDGVATRCPL